jgi:hypothetical protein
VLCLRLICTAIAAAFVGCATFPTDDARTIEPYEADVSVLPTTTAWTESVSDRLALARSAALRSVFWPKGHAALKRLRGPRSIADVGYAPIRTVLLIGASTMQWAVGRAIERRLTHAPVRVLNAARSATGLARPDHHDWLAESVRLAKEQKPDVVIVQFGGNDCQSLFDAEGAVVVDYDARQRSRCPSGSAADGESKSSPVRLGDESADGTCGRDVADSGHLGAATRRRAGW